MKIPGERKVSNLHCRPKAVKILIMNYWVYEIRSILLSRLMSRQQKADFIFRISRELHEEVRHHRVHTWNNTERILEIIQTIFGYSFNISLNYLQKTKEELSFAGLFS